MTAREKWTPRPGPRPPAELAAAGRQGGRRGRRGGAATLARRRRRVASCERNDRFEEISPEVGELDEQAVERALDDDPDETLALLAELTGATDPVLRDLARRLAGRLFLDLSRRGPVRPRGVGKLATQSVPTRRRRSRHRRQHRCARDRPRRRDGGRRRTISGFGRGRRPDTAICLLVDRSGSMGGGPLATSAVAAASIAWRAPDDYSVLSFGKDVVAAKSQDVSKSNEAVVDAVLALRGFGTTDVVGALDAGRRSAGTFGSGSEDRRSCCRTAARRAMVRVEAIRSHTWLPQCDSSTSWSSWRRNPTTR